MLRYGVLLPLLVLPACAASTRSEVTQNAAESVVNRVLLARYPDIPLSTGIDCVIANASRPERNALASNTLGGVNAATIETVEAILRRQETRQCLSAGGAGLSS